MLSGQILDGKNILDAQNILQDGDIGGTNGKIRYDSTNVRLSANDVDIICTYVSGYENYDAILYYFVIPNNNSIYYVKAEYTGTSNILVRSIGLNCLNKDNISASGYQNKWCFTNSMIQIDGAKSVVNEGDSLFCLVQWRRYVTG